MTEQQQKPPTISYAEREEAILDLLTMDWGVLPSEVDPKKDIRPHLSHDATNGDQVTVLFSGRTLPFGDTELAAELAERIKQRRHGDAPERLVQQVAHVHGREKAETVRHCLRFEAETGTYVYRAPLSQAPPAAFDDLDQALQYALPQVLRYFELQRRQQQFREQSGDITELAREQRARGRSRTGGPDYGI